MSAQTLFLPDEENFEMCLCALLEDIANLNHVFRATRNDTTILGSKVAAMNLQRAGA
ncbi:hypothetical protein [Candidatus Methylobacter favarea]|uniref:hypothetical protein n=1 Tax=Candidatus Methylobacter favarea TaxID=2707345 RepID=UPI00157D82DF|nr:hypothetical protein [Candidatus Methylobacter favarea]